MLKTDPHPLLWYYSRLLGNNPSWEPHCNIFAQGQPLKTTTVRSWTLGNTSVVWGPFPLSSAHLVSREPTCSAIDGSTVHSQYHLSWKGEISSYSLLPLEFVDMGQMPVLIFLKFPEPNGKALKWITGRPHHITWDEKEKLNFFLLIMLGMKSP